MDNLTFLKPLVARVLRDKSTVWSVQGFGMMRTYFGPVTNPKEFRLNIWDSRLAVKSVSTVHDHPWHFESLIVNGMFCNRRYEMISSSDDFGCITSPGEQAFAYTTIKTGEGGGMEKEPTRYAMLHRYPVETYSAGDTYRQSATEIHETLYADGCVTLNQRQPVGDGDHARVFWPAGTDWVDAMPREATPVEVAAVTENALQGF